MARARRLLTEPLVHFTLLGTALFVAFQLWGERPAPERVRIEVTPAHVQHLVEGFARIWRRPPTSAELWPLIEDHVHEEILYREALALGLDQDDTIVRRRLRQKMEFLFDELAPPAEPTRADLERHLDQHGDAYRVDALQSFRQVFVSPDRRGPAARAQAEQLLLRLEELGERDGYGALGDPTQLPERLEAASTADVDRTFGPGFAAALGAIAVGQWSGPVESSYGLHLVRIEARVGGRTAALEEVESALRDDWLFEQRRTAHVELLERYRSRYEVVVDWPAREQGEGPVRSP